MGDDMLKDLKKLFVLKIVNPGLYWMTEYESEKFYSKEVNQFECLLEENVKKFKITQEICIGKMVAVKDETGFHRGLVTEIFNRGSKLMYWISLIDHERVIETGARKIYFIKNKNLRAKEPNAFEVSIKGIEPASLVLDCDKNVLGCIFQKRKCANWSSTAFKFVKNLFEKNPKVFVKPFSNSKRKISGEIYFIQASNGMPVSLGQKLCDEGFAVINDAVPKYNIQDFSNICIEEKIPKNAYFEGLQNSKVIETFSQENNDKWDVNTDGTKTWDVKNSTEFDDSFQKLSLNRSKAQSESSSHSSTATVSEKKNLKLYQSTSHKLGDNRYNCNSVKNKGTCESEKSETNSAESHSINLIRIIQKNMKIYDE